MYTSEHFRESRIEVIAQFIVEHPFAVLVTHGDRGLEATHLPMLFDLNGGQGALSGHLAKANGQWRNISDGDNVLAIFRGPQSYISPVAYSQEPDVPTWNYMAVHARGRWKLVNDRVRSIAHLRRIVAHHESGRGSPWPLSQLDAGFLEGLLHGIVGFEIEILHLDCAFKISQDKPLQDRIGVIEWLASQGSPTKHELADRMREYFGFD